MKAEIVGNICVVTGDDEKPILEVVGDLVHWYTDDVVETTAPEVEDL